MCEQTRKEIAQRVEPSTKSEIAQRLAQKDTEAALISDAMLDEVMYMVQQGKVKPADKRTVPNLHEIDGKWVIKYKKTLDSLEFENEIAEEDVGVDDDGGNAVATE